MAALLVPLAMGVVGAPGIAGNFASDGGYTWQHAQKFGLSRSTDGYEVRLERVYADVNRIAVFATVTDTAHRSSIGPEMYGVSLVDSAGTAWEWNTAIGLPGPLTSGSLYWFAPTGEDVTAGRRAFAVKVEGVSGQDGHNEVQHPVNLSFPITLNVAAGTSLPSGKTVTASGVTVTLDRFLIAPSSARLRLHWSGMPADKVDLTPIVFVRHDGKDLLGPGGFGTASIGSTSWTEYTGLGAPNPKGHWELEISQFVNDVVPANGTAADATTYRISVAGPWLLEFDVP